MSRIVRCGVQWLWGIWLFVLVVPAAATVRSQSLYARGLIPFNNGQFEQALRLFDQAVQADATDALALYYRGLTHARRGAAAAAIRDIEQALKLRPQLTNATLDLGILYFDTQQYPAARTWLERAHDQTRNRFAAAYFLGLTHLRQNNYDTALAYFEETKADPELRPVAQYYTGLILSRQGHAEDARVELEKTAREQPTSDIGRVAQRYSGVSAPQAPGETAPAEPWSVYGQLGFEYDSNVVIGPSESAVKGRPGISSDADARVVLGAGGGYTLLDAEAWSLRAQYDFYQSIHFDLTEFDLQGHRVRLEAASKPDVVSYGAVAAYAFYALDYQTFFQEGLATPWIAVAEGETAATQFYYRLRARDFFREPFDPGRDALNQGFGVRQFLGLGDIERLLTFGYQFETEDTVSDGPQGNEFEFNAHQTDVELELPLWDVAKLDLGYLFRLEDYQFPNSRANFTVRRHDNEHQFVVAVARELTENLAVGLHYLGIVNNSNIPAFEYDRHIIGADVRVSF